MASVGLTAAKAEDRGLNVKVLDYDLASIAGSSEQSDAYVGKARAIVDLDRGVLVGATFVGPDIAELLHSATIAVVGEVPVKRPLARGAVVPDGQRGVAAVARSTLGRDSA